MLKATVVGPVWATKRLDGFPPGALLEVEAESTEQRYVALDTLGSGPGDQVLVALGSAAAQHLPGVPPIDALVVGVVDEPASSAAPARVSASNPTRKAQQ